MIRFKITKKALKYHFDYLGWMYLLMPVVLVLFWSLFYTFTEYQAPDDKIMSLYLVGNAVDQERVDALSAEIEPMFPEMEEYDVLSITLGDTTDYYNWQRFSTLVYAQQGDVYIMDSEIFEVYGKEGAFMPLDGLIDTDIDLGAATFATTDDAQPHVYGIPADSLYGFIDKEFYDNRRATIAVMAYSTNPEESAALVQHLVDTRAAPPPQNIDQWDPKPPVYVDVDEYGMGLLE